jgi:hypothetical protein
MNRLVWAARTVLAKIAASPAFRGAHRPRLPAKPVTSPPSNNNCFFPTLTQYINPRRPEGTTSAFAFSFLRPVNKVYPQITHQTVHRQLRRQSPVATPCSAIRLMAVPHNILPPIGNVTSAPALSNNAMGRMSPAAGQLDSNADIMTRPQPTQAPQTQDPLRRPPAPPLDTMRAYRACLNCRNRKSKCDLDINGGRPVSSALCLRLLFGSFESFDIASVLVGMINT